MTSRYIIYDITSAEYMAQYALYMTFHPWFMTLQHSIHDIKAIISHLTLIISESTSTVSLSSHPDYGSHKAIVGMVTQPQYVWHHMNYIWHHVHSLWYHTTLWYYTHCIHVIKPRIPVITCTVSGRLLIVYWLYHSIKPNHSVYDVTSTSGMTSHPLYQICIHCIFVIKTSPLISHPLLNDITPSFCVTSYALYRTSHPILMSSQYCTYDITASIYETISSM